MFRGRVSSHLSLPTSISATQARDQDLKRADGTNLTFDRGHLCRFYHYDLKGANTVVFDT